MKLLQKVRCHVFLKHSVVIFSECCDTFADSLSLFNSLQKSWIRLYTTDCDEATLSCLLGNVADELFPLQLKFIMFCALRIHPPLSLCFALQQLSAAFPYTVLKKPRHFCILFACIARRNTDLYTKLWSEIRVKYTYLFML